MFDFTGLNEEEDDIDPDRQVQLQSPLNTFKLIREINQRPSQYSPPPLNTADLKTYEKAAVFGNQRYWESYITYKTLIWDLEMGGGIGRAAVLGGGGPLY